MNKAPNLTDAQRARIIHLREEEGVSQSAIARDLGISLGSVSWFCLINGVERLGKLPKALPPVPTESREIRRGAHLIRPFTAADDVQLLVLEAQGINPSQIGKRMDPPRQPNSIRCRLATLARHEAVDEEQSA